MLIFSAKPLQFNKKWLEHSKQFLIVLFKVSNCLIYGYINMMIFHHDVQRLSYSVQSGVFLQTVGQDKMPDKTFEPYRKIAVIDEEGKIESPGIPPQGNSGERLETGSQQIIEINIQQYPRIPSEFWLKPMHHLANSRMTVGIVVNSAVKLNTLGYIRRIILIGASLYSIAYKIAQLYFSVRTGKEYMCQIVHDKRFTSSLQRRSFTSSIGTSCPSSFCKEVTPLSMNPQGLI